MKRKRVLSIFIIVLITLTLFSLKYFENKKMAQNTNANESKSCSDVNDKDLFNEIQAYSDVRGKDLSALNLKNQSELLFTLTFDTYTKWPSKDKMPQEFNPEKLLEQGKDPGLGIRKLQQQGYTGTGVTVAYIDQHLLLNHNAYLNVNLHNYDVQAASLLPSMHGPSVLSLLAGEKIGIVPNSDVYFFRVDGGGNDANEYEAKAFEKVIEVNKTLPKDKKIKIIGMSHGADDNLNAEYAKHLIEAEEAARKSGIIVVDVKCGMATCGVKGFQNRDDYKNYEISNWEKVWKKEDFSNKLIAPSDCRTTAIGYKENPNHYAYWGAEGGFSWGVPYITGVITMGLQVNPNLTEKEAFKYLHESAYKYLGGDLINPEGFLKMVKQNCNNPHDVTLDKDYRYFLYNKNKVSENDLKSINEYINKFEDGTTSVLKDVSKYTSAVEIYNMLKNDFKNKNGKLKGIQIFGTSNDVPAFDIHYKIQMKKGIDECDNFKSDFFYSNFESDSSCLKNNFSIYKAFKNKLNVSFIPNWTVSRLPLTKGEIASFIYKNNEYVDLVNNKPFGGFVNFSNPIFASNEHVDDFGYFLKERIDKEFNILGSSEYKLYGNKQGCYPVNTDVFGDFTKENIAKENKDGIKEFIINSHGQWNNIDQCIYTTNDKNSEKRISFMNTSDINNILSSNYYDLDLWTCLNGYNLDDKNLIHEAMNKGKCMSAMAASSVISNNGIHNDASLEDMKKNNFYYFYLNYLYNRALGRTRSEDFNLAKTAYAKEILKNTNILEDGNYQFNIHNVLSYHYFGLIEYWNYCSKIDFNPTIDWNTENDSNNFKFDGNIKFAGRLKNGFKIKSFKAKRVKNNIEFTLGYESPRNCDYSFYNPDNEDEIMKVMENGIKKGNNTAKLYLNMDEFNKVLSANSIVMKLGFDDKGSLIEFDTSQLKSLKN